jgi:hypothetical protein
VTQADVDGIKDAAGDIVAAVRRLLEDVRAGRLAQAPAEGAPDSARESWL